MVGSESVVVGKRVALALHERITIRGITLVLGFSVVAFLALGSLTWPFSDDHQHYAFAGDTLFSGGTLYRDAFDMKGPLNYFIFGLARSEIGQNELSIRVFDLVFVSLFCWQLYSLVLRLSGRHTFFSTFAVLYFLLYYYGTGYYQTAQPEDWAGMLTLVGVALITDTRRRHSSRMICAAAVFAMAALLKPTFLAFTPLLALSPNSKGLFSSANLKRSFLALCPGGRPNSPTSGHLKLLHP